MNRFKNIILIDDDYATNTFHSEIFSEIDADWNIQILNDSSKAIEFINQFETNVENEEKTLIFLDINMPGYNGWDVLEKINWKEKPSSILNKLNIVILSSSRNPEEKERALKNKNISGYIVKPITPAKIVDLFVAL